MWMGGFRLAALQRMASRCFRQQQLKLARTQACAQASERRKRRQVRKLTADNDAQQGRIRALAPIIQHKLEELAQTVQARRDGGVEAALRIVDTDTGQNDMQEAETTVSGMRIESGLPS